MGIAPVESRDSPCGESAPIVPEAAPLKSPPRRSRRTPSPPKMLAATPRGRSAETPAAAAAEEQIIEVWRPGRFENRERHRRRPNRGDRPAQPGARRSRAAGGRRRATASRRRGGKSGRRECAAARTPSPPASSAPRKCKTVPNGAMASGRSTTERQAALRRQARAPGINERFDQGERRERQDRQHERQPDPNSPFAKLAALKAQLEADSKERR